MRFGFLFNHDQIHQVAHSLPIALALAGMRRDGDEVLAITTNARCRDAVARLAGPALGTAITPVSLGLKPLSRVVGALVDSVVPSAKLLIYRDNLDFFRSLDVLVVAEKTSLVLKTRYGLDALRIVHTRHGAGDRAIGFDRASARFDHVLCSGEKIRERLIGEVGLAPEKVTIVGYPKFDLLTADQLAPRRATGKRRVLYNPHPSPRLSSWFRHGRAVLDQFVDNADFSLIFAPHVMLFQRKFVLSIDPPSIARPGRIAARYRQSPNIVVDTGSEKLSDMSYTMDSDIYLGDVSSQVYEFIRKPGPCVFLNSHGVAWQDDPNYLHWRMGRVIDDPAQLPAALASAQAEFESRYRAVQEELFARSFSLEGRSSDRAARALLRLTGQQAAGGAA